MHTPSRAPGWFCATATLGLPILVTFFWYTRYALSIIAGVEWSQLKPKPANVDPFEVSARDIGGRMQFGIASALLCIIAAASIVLAWMLVANRFGKRIASAVVLCAAGLGILVYYYVDHPGLFSPLLEQIKTVAPSARPFEMVDTIFRWNPAASMVAGTSLLGAFVCIAVPACKTESGSEALRARMRGLEQITICSSLLLVMLTAVNKTLIDWPQAFLLKPNQEAYAYLAGAISTFWGTFGTIFLASALLPAFISLRCGQGWKG